MKILVTGAHGFVGKNLIKRLQNNGYTDILECVRGSSEDELMRYCMEADFVFHLAGVNRPENNDEYYLGLLCKRGLMKIGFPAKKVRIPHGRHQIRQL